MTLTTLMGLLAATCNTTAFVPQVTKAWHTQSTADISIGMFLLLVVGIVLRLVYGALLRHLPLIVANVVTLGLAGTYHANAALRIRRAQ